MAGKKLKTNTRKINGLRDKQGNDQFIWLLFAVVGLVAAIIVLREMVGMGWEKWESSIKAPSGEIMATERSGYLGRGLQEGGDSNGSKV